MSLRILHITEDCSTLNTGITSTIQQLTGWLVNSCDWVGVYSTGKVDVTLDKNVHVYSNDDFVFPQFRRKPRLLRERLIKIIQENNVQILHLHGVWRAAPWVGQQVASLLGVPTVWSVHGQFEKWAIYGQGRLKKWKKQLYWYGIAKPVFQNVSCVHAITPLEQNNIARLLPGKRVRVIPNAVVLPKKREQVVSSIPKKEVLFLGRIHPVKGVDLLMKAFAECGLGDDWKLLIAGPEEVKAYAENLKGWVHQHDLTDRISFLGAVYGSKKLALLEQAWIVVVPSQSEVVGMVNLEAGLCETPTITTYATGLTDWEDGGGVLTEADVPSLCEALRSCCSWSIRARFERGEMSRKLVESSYSLDVAGEKWLALYQSINL